MAVAAMLTLTSCSSAETAGRRTPQALLTPYPTLTLSANIHRLSGAVSIDGSSTVFPITEAAAEEFGAVAPKVRVTVGVSGTGGGFKRFCNGETDISNASRAIKDSEKQECVKKGIDYLELRIAFDGLSMLVNPSNHFVDYLTVDELKRIWEPGSAVSHWNQVRPNWPNQSIALFGPGTDSGTFDYFTEAIVGKARASRSDYTASEDDNVLIQGIAGQRYALGYFGYAYYVENKDKLRVVPVDPGDGKPVAPSPETISTGRYRPLSRPLLVYVNLKSLREKDAVREFVKFYVNQSPLLVDEVGYVQVPLPDFLADIEKIRSALALP